MTYISGGLGLQIASGYDQNFFTWLDSLSLQNVMQYGYPSLFYVLRAESEMNPVTF
jgi:hypothetical protein